MSISVDIKPREYLVKTNLDKLYRIGCEDLVKNTYKIYENWAIIHDLFNFSSSNRDIANISKELEQIEFCKNTNDMNNKINTIIKKIENLYGPKAYYIYMRNNLIDIKHNYVYQNHLKNIKIKYMPSHERPLKKNIIYENYDNHKNNPYKIVGRRIKVLGQNNKHFSGKIINYNKSDNTHEIFYNDREKKKYILSEKEWFFEEDNDRGLVNWQFNTLDHVNNKTIKGYEYIEELEATKLVCDDKTIIFDNDFVSFDNFNPDITIYTNYDYILFEKELDHYIRLTNTLLREVQNSQTKERSFYCLLLSHYNSVKTLHKMFYQRLNYFIRGYVYYTGHWWSSLFGYSTTYTSYKLLLDCFNKIMSPLLDEPYRLLNMLNENFYKRINIFKNEISNITLYRNLDAADESQEQLSKEQIVSDLQSFEFINNEFKKV